MWQIFASDGNFTVIIQFIRLDKTPLDIIKYHKYTYETMNFALK